MRGIMGRTAGRSGMLLALVAALAMIGGDHVQAEPQPSLKAMTSEAIELQRAGKLEPAVALATSIARRVEAEYGDRDVRHAQALNNLALLHDLSGRPLKSERLYRRAIAIVESQLRPSALQLAELTNNLASTLVQQCRLNAARQAYEEALTLAIGAAGSYHAVSAMVRENLRDVERAMAGSAPGGPAAPSSGSPVAQILRGCIS